MAVDLKVLVRSFNRESRACYVGNPRESFFRVREIFFRESFVKVGYHESVSLHTLQLVKGYHLLPPGVLQENGTAPYVAAKLPKVSQIPWPGSTSLHLPLVLPNVAF